MYYLSILTLSLSMSSLHRCSRVNSAASGNSSSAEPPTSTDESSNQVVPQVVPQTPASAPPGGCETTNSSVSSTPVTPGSAQQGKAFRFPKTKKVIGRFNFNEKRRCHLTYYFRTCYFLLM